MMTYLKILILVSITYGCSGSSFTGDNSKKNFENGTSGEADPNKNGDAKEGARDSSDPNDPAGSCNFTSDHVKFKFPAAIKACAESGKIFDFALNECTEMPSNAECKFEEVMTQIAQLNFDRTKIETGMVNAANQLPFKEPVTRTTLRKRAKLVSCGQSPDKRSVVAQWWFVPDSLNEKTQCEFNKELNILTVCYRAYKEDERRPAPATNSEEHAKIVSACLRQL